MVLNFVDLREKGFTRKATKQQYACLRGKAHDFKASSLVGTLSEVRGAGLGYVKEREAALGRRSG